MIALPAAHCIQQKQSREKLSPSQLVVLLGRYNLDAKIELDSINARVDEIIIHPEWRAFDEKFDADLAMLVFKESVKFTDFIQPVCLPTDDSIDKYYSGTLVEVYSRVNCEKILKS